MKLRGRFTVTLAFAALIPITIAAVITTRVLTKKWRDNYNTNRNQATAFVEREVHRLEQDVQAAASALASGSTGRPP